MIRSTFISDWMTFSFANLLIWGVAIVTLAMLRKVWLSERARRSVERVRAKHIPNEREFASARRRERGDS